MFGIFDRFHSYGASARVADGRLVLSLPDAETPALWMMDLNDAATSVLRLETDRQGLYVIKKHGGKGAAETIAVYRDRHTALDALNKASRALEKARSVRHNMNGRPVIVRPASIIGRIFTYLLFFWFILYLMSLDQLLIASVFDVFSSPEAPVTATSTSNGMLDPPVPSLEVPGDIMGGIDAPAAEPKAPTPSGVPVSADDFLRGQVQ